MLTQTQLNTLITALAADMKEAIAKIEASPDTTQHHYSNYGAFISNLSKGNPKVAHIISLALLKAGANPVGVANAVKLLV